MDASTNAFTDAVSVLSAAKRVLYSMAGTIGVGFLSIGAFLRYGGLSGSTGLLDLTVGEVVSLLAIPASLALLAYAATLLEKSLWEKRRADGKERLKEIADPRPQR